MIQPGDDQRPRAHLQQRAGALELHAAVHAGGGDEQAIAVGVQSGLQRLQERREDRVVDAGDHGADGVGAACVERARERVGREFEAGEDPQHVLAGCRRDRWRAVQDPRCGGDRDPGLARDIPQGDSPRGLLAPQWSAFGHSDSGASYAEGALRPFATGTPPGAARHQVRRAGLRLLRSGRSGRRRARRSPACTRSVTLGIEILSFGGKSVKHWRAERNARPGTIHTVHTAHARRRRACVGERARAITGRPCPSSPRKRATGFPVTGHKCYSSHM